MEGRELNRRTGQGYSIVHRIVMVSIKTWDYSFVYKYNMYIN